MEIYKLFDNKKYFKIEFNEDIDSSDMLHIEEIIKDSFDMSKKLNLKKPRILPKEIELDFEHSLSYAKMSIKTKNQKGLMAYLMSIFDEYGLDISMAKIQTIKNRARNLILIEKTIYLHKNKDKLLEDLICVE